MPNVTIRVSDDLKAELDDHPEINWSEVARESMREYLRKLPIAEETAAAESQLTEDDAEELGEAVKRAVAEHY
jgi:Arc/MetJ-type ribon-helix-helix transcriptional regulator